MVTCEICGKEYDNCYMVSIEGAKMVSCAKCSAGGKILYEIKAEKNPGRQRNVNSGEILEEYDIAEDYGQIIRKKREQLGFSMQVLAERINEKESMLKRIEEERLLPSPELVKKLENELGINLMAKVQKPSNVPKINNSEPIDMWDAAYRKEK